MNEQQLKPCPFCGYAGQDQIKGDLYIHSELAYDDAAYDDPEDVSYEPDLDDRIVWHAVCCPGCRAMGPEHETVQEARAAWQNRAG